MALSIFGHGMVHKTRLFEHFFQCSHLFTRLDESCDSVANIASGFFQIISTRRYIEWYAVGDYDRTLFKVNDRDCLELGTHNFIFSIYSSECKTLKTTAAYGAGARLSINLAGRSHQIHRINLN